MAKVMIIGIDSVDAGLLSRFEKDLPNFSRLKQQSPDIKLKSVYPPDSVTAWASIYTGWNPARHGLVYFVDPIDKVSQVAIEDVDNTILRGNTFWDFASRAGKRVCILFPHIGYPVWPVNGIMVGRTNQRDIRRFPILTFPASLSREYDLSHLNTPKGYPSSRKLPWYIKTWRRIISDEAEFALRMLKASDWDLFFVYSSALDWVQHNLWRYFDENDPSYPGDNAYRNTIKDFYRVYDDMVGKLISAVASDTAIIVLSDHGHGMRPTKVVNINEILREKGLLLPKIKRQSYADPYYLMERVKRKLADAVNKFGLGDSVLKAMHALPAWRKIYTSPLSIDWEKTTAYISDLSGIKAYTYGGIIIKKEKLGNEEYERLRGQLVEELSQIREPHTGEGLMRWICRREDLYSGEYLYRYPDIVFELKAGYGAGWSIYDSLITDAYSHSIQPGSHKADSPVLFVVNSPKGLGIKDITLTDIAPVILDLLGLEKCINFS